MSIEQWLYQQFPFIDWHTLGPILAIGMFFLVLVAAAVDDK